MSEYIEREAVLDNSNIIKVQTREYGSIEVVPVEYIAELSVVDVTPVRHGFWIDKPTGRYGQWQSWCSVCVQHSGIGGIESNRHKPYCPNCGAKMDKEQ